MQSLAGVWILVDTLESVAMHTFLGGGGGNLTADLVLYSLWFLMV